MSKQVNYNENLCSGAAIRDDKGRRISKLFEASHPKMTVGYAKNLIMPDTPTEQKFNFRQSGGGVIEDGVAVIDKVKGRSLVWNQLIPMKASGTTETINGVTITYTDNGFLLQGTATKSFRFTTLGTCNLKEGHKYLTFGGSSGTSLQIEQWGGNPIDSRKGQPAIVAISTTPTALGQINIYCLGDEIFIGEELHWQFCDLTQMFGAGNEPTTYEEFLQRKPRVADEYAYNEGTIVNNKVEAVVTTGRNIWDEEWELGSYDASGGKIASSDSIRSKNMFACLPHTSYYWRIPDKANGSYMGFCFFYDISGAFISTLPVGPKSYLTVTTPSNARFIAFNLRTEYGTTYNNDICINLSDPSFNGQYAPYEEHTLDLSWVKDIKDTEGVKLFEDGMKSAGTAFDEAGKNKAVKRFGVKVFDGTEEFSIFDTYPSRFWFLIQDAKKDATTLKANLYGKGMNTADTPDKTVGYSGGMLAFCFRDSEYTTVISFKQHLSDLYAQGNPLVLYYELAEPIEVEYDEKNLTYPVVAGGTEEAIASEPSTAFRADIGYGIDAVKTILDLKARVEALEGK